MKAKRSTIDAAADLDAWAAQQEAEPPKSKSKVTVFVRPEQTERIGEYLEAARQAERFAALAGSLADQLAVDCETLRKEESMRSRAVCATVDIVGSDGQGVRYSRAGNYTAIPFKENAPILKETFGEDCATMFRAVDTLKLKPGMEQKVAELIGPQWREFFEFKRELKVTEQGHRMLHCDPTTVEAAAGLPEGVIQQYKGSVKPK